MKNLRFVLCCAILTLLSTCTNDQELPDIRTSNGPWIAVSNWTGHNRFCSPGETLVFAITKGGNTKEFKLVADTGSTYYDDLKEGDLIDIVVSREDGEILHQRRKQFTPSDPEAPSPDSNGSPLIQICEIGELLVAGF